MLESCRNLWLFQMEDVINSVKMLCYADLILAILMIPVKNLDLLFKSGILLYLRVLQGYR